MGSRLSVIASMARVLDVGVEGRGDAVDAVEALEHDPGLEALPPNL